MPIVAWIVVLQLLCSSVMGMSRSKLSIHTGMGPDSQQIIMDGQPRLVKLLDNFDASSSIKKQVPGIVVVGRIFLSTQPTGGDPGQAAIAWWNRTASTIMTYPAVDYWEGYNEPSVGTVSDMQWYAQMEVARVNILAKNGRRAAIGCFSVGVPDVTTPAVVQAFYPALDAAIAHGGILATHEYGAPFVNATFSGSPETGQGWLTGRYRRLYNTFLVPTNRTLPLAITENGIDGGTCGISGTCPSHLVDGWKGFCDYWASIGQADCNAFYLQQLSWYDQVMRADSYVLGSTVFSLEISGWDAFDISPLTDIFTAYLRSA